MSNPILGEAYLQELTRPVAAGDRVNMHVVTCVPQREPDYEAMRRLVTGANTKENKSAADEHVRG